ncbi:MAG TPA: hypothetical protein VFX16_32385 [Pseudonocardiaceae bacterium]|nr:hypothetical protein [Pseudonocardiaceae bacterium]
MLDDGWPDAGTVPWQLLLRIRCGYQVDVLLASVIQRAVVPGLPEQIGGTFARTVTAIAARAVSVGRAEQRELAAERLGGIARALAEFDDFCGTWPHPHWWLGGGDPDIDPDPHPWREGGLAEVAVIIDAASRLVMDIGSADLRRSLGVALEDTLATLQETSNSL